MAAVAAVAVLALATIGVVRARAGDDPAGMIASAPVNNLNTTAGTTIAPAPGTTSGTTATTSVETPTSGPSVPPAGAPTTTGVSGVPSTTPVPGGPTDPPAPTETTAPPVPTTAAPRAEDITIDLRGAPTNQARPTGSLQFDATVRNGSTATLLLYQGGSHCRPKEPMFEMSTVATFDSAHGVVGWDGSPETLAAVLTPPVASTLAEFRAEQIVTSNASMCGPLNADLPVEPGATYERHFDTTLRMSPGPAPATVFARSTIPRGPTIGGVTGWLRTQVSSPVMELPYVDDPLRTKPFGPVAAAVVQHPQVAAWVAEHVDEGLRAQAIFFDGTWQFRFQGDDFRSAEYVTVDAATVTVTDAYSGWERT